MAQDFHAAFGLNGDDDTHINLSDSAGLSLVAIQELNKRLKQKDEQITQNNARIAALQARLKARTISSQRALPNWSNALQAVPGRRPRV